MHQIHCHPALGQDLRRARRVAGLTQAGIATRTGFSLPTVRAAERSEGALTTFLLLAASLGMEIGGGSLPAGDELGARLAVLRKRRGLGRRTVAELAGISPTTLASLEKKNAGHLTTVIKVGEAVGARLRLIPLGSNPGYWTAAATSSVHQSWTTPPELLDLLYGVVGGSFGLDPCSPVRRGPLAPVKARLRYVQADDGLSAVEVGNRVYQSAVWSTAPALGCEGACRGGGGPGGNGVRSVSSSPRHGVVARACCRCRRRLDAQRPFILREGRQRGTLSVGNRNLGRNRKTSCGDDEGVSRCLACAEASCRYPR